MLHLLAAADAALPAREVVRHLGCGINLGNTLEPPAEGTWNNPPAQEHYFREIRHAGFSWVRLPVHWGSHLGENAPYALDEAWLARVEEVVDWALAAGLFVSIDAHHEQWIKDKPGDALAMERFVALWRQIGDRFAQKSPRLLFELLHDPVGLSQSTLDELNTRCLAAIRSSQPTRWVALASLIFPAPDEVLAAAVPDDPYVFGTVYFFHPPAFTFEGQGTWGSAKDQAEVREFCVSGSMVV